jgi:hypothetical protein
MVALMVLQKALPTVVMMAVLLVVTTVEWMVV